MIRDFILEFLLAIHYKDLKLKDLRWNKEDKFKIVFLLNIPDLLFLFGESVSAYIK